jgi:hypothetical protein
MASANVRISISARETLRRLAHTERQSMQSILDRAIEAYRRERFLRDANADFAALKKNRKAWREELAERKLWERTLGDGLDDE